jgi:hypothetical protein
MRSAPEQHEERAAIARLGQLARSVGLLGAATPRDSHLEHARLLADYAAGRERLPVWTYEPNEAAPLLDAIDAVAASLRPLERSPLGMLYQARAAELRLEIEAVRSVGTGAFAACAAARFAASPERRDADALASTWCREPDVPEDSPTLASDDRDARSLVSRLRAEVARRKLPFTIRTSASLSALAAISGDTLWVAEGRRLTARDVERTVVHEIEAHALPRVRARVNPVPIFAIGTAGGSDDQEGYALWLEEARSVSGPGRRRELGARHEAVVAMRDGADFVSVVRGLRGRGVALETSLRAAERAFRGSHGVTPGLGRERVYLDALVRVRARLAEAPEDEAVLAAGQVAVGAIDALRRWVKGATEA